MCRGKYLVGLPLLTLFAMGVSDLRGEELYYHSDNHNSLMTTYTPSGYPKAVKFDLPVSSRTYEVTSFGVLSQASGGFPFPENTQIAVRVWDSSGAPLYTSDPFDLGGEDGSLAMRWFQIASDHVQVSDSFYAGVQEVSGEMDFGYKVDIPSGSQYGRSYRYKVSTGTWTLLTDDDIWFNTMVSAVSEPLLGDLDGDGFVGGADLDIVRGYWGQSVAPGSLQHGDPSGDGFVGGDDLDVVRSHWGDGTPPAPDAVPEPSSLALLGMGSLRLLAHAFASKTERKIV